MIFTPPSCVPKLAADEQTSSLVGDFVLNGSRANLPRESNGGSLIDPVTRERLDRHDLLVEVEALAAGLAAELAWPAAAPDGERRVVALLSENTIRYMVYCWALHRLGASCLLLHTTNSAQENAEMMRLAGCNILISSPGQAIARQKLVDQLRHCHVLEFLTTKPSAESLDQSGLKTLMELTALGRALPQIAKPTASQMNASSDVAFLCSTSGTTGSKKLARVTHSSLVAMVRQIAAFAQIARDTVDTTPSVLPLSHAYGIMLINGSIYTGDTVIVHDKVDMKVFLSIQTFKANKLYTVPSMVAAFVNTPFLFRMIDLSSLTAMGVGTSALSAEVIEKMQNLHPKCKVLVGYGLTECGPVSATLPDDILPGSSGVLFPSYEARLIRSDGEEVEGFDECGELYVRSPSIVAGYLGEGEANLATFQDGWLRTGDVAQFRKSSKGNAHLFIVDRLRDMIKVKGLQIVPIDIENCLRKHAGVKDAAVVGIDNADDGERAMAFIVPTKRLRTEKAKSDLSKALGRHVEQHMTEPHWLKGQVVFVEEFPRNGTGKVLKRELRTLRVSR